MLHIAKLDGVKLFFKFQVNLFQFILFYLKLIITQSSSRFKQIQIYRGITANSSSGRRI